MMIDRTDPLPVGKQAKLLGISRGTVYYLPRATSQTDLALTQQIDQLHLEHPFMGQRMLVRQLKRQGVQVGRLHVRTLMQRMGICAMAPQPNPPNLSLSPCKPTLDAALYVALGEAGIAPEHAGANWLPARQTPVPAI
jgi:hypothetical protein